MLRVHIFLLFNICFLQSQIIVHVEKALLIEIITYNIDNLRAVIFLPLVRYDFDHRNRIDEI